MWHFLCSTNCIRSLGSVLLLANKDFRFKIEAWDCHMAGLSMRGCINLASVICEYSKSLQLTVLLS